MSDSFQRAMDFLGDLNPKEAMNAWVEVGCESLEWPQALVVFDAALDQGTGFALRLAGKAYESLPAAILVRLERYLRVSKLEDDTDYLTRKVERLIRLYDFAQI